MTSAKIFHYQENICAVLLKIERGCVPGIISGVQLHVNACHDTTFFGRPRPARIGNPCRRATAWTQLRETPYRAPIYSSFSPSSSLATIAQRSVRGVRRVEPIGASRRVIALIHDRRSSRQRARRRNRASRRCRGAPISRKTAFPP